jgi:putative transposase
VTAYRRARVAGATGFFTVGLAKRRGAPLLVERIDALGAALRAVQARHPFQMDAVVVLPDHLHCVWSLPDGDTDYSTRWGLIKAAFSRTVERGERRSQSRIKRGERGIWQRRFWEHRIRDDDDLARHMDYTHWNPVKHGHVSHVADWPHSSFRRHVARRVYPLDWGGGGPIEIAAGE